MTILYVGDEMTLSPSEKRGTRTGWKLNLTPVTSMRYFRSWNFKKQ